MPSNGRVGEVAVFIGFGGYPPLFSSRKETRSLSTYPIKDVLALWSQEKLTPEQAIGQLILNLLEVVSRLQQVEQRLRTLEKSAPAANG